jgi:dTDP-4-dehydrorhamnose reductase
MIIVTGGTGQVGRALIEFLNSEGIEFLAPAREEFPLDDSGTILNYLTEHNFTTLVHLSAETNVDFCESNQSEAIQRNVKSVEVIADFCKLNNRDLIFVSSSAVLSGDSNFMHGERAEYSPANFYGKTKMNAEKYIVENNSRYLIIRASWMLGIGDKVKKFGQLVYEKILSGEDIIAAFDKFGSLTSSFRLAEFIMKNLMFSESGIIHIASTTPCSRYEIAKHISHRLGKEAVIKPVSNDVFDLPAPRGFSEGLTSEIATSEYGYIGLTWELELNDFLERVY